MPGFSLKTGRGILVYTVFLTSAKEVVGCERRLQNSPCGTTQETAEADCITK